jgi:signal transduction histidine kinase
VKRRFLEWLDALDPGLQASMRRSITPWLMTAAMAMGVILVGGVLPVTGDFFQLDVKRALAVWAAVFGFGICANLIDRRFELEKLAFAVAALSSCAVVLFFACSMIALSRPPGSSAMAALAILAASYYGYLYRMTARFPFGWLAMLVAFGGALALNEDEGNWAVFALAAPTAFGGSWLVGTMTYRMDRARIRSESLKAAVQAQILDEASRNVSRLSGAMLHVLETTHDASNALSTALINAELLRKSTEARSRGERLQIDEWNTAEELTRQLVRLRSLVEETREVGHAGGNRIDEPRIVAPLPVISDVSRELRVRYPDIEFVSSGSESSIGVIVSGGVDSLRRVLENLLLNACQGDGRRGAQRVEVSLEEAPNVGSIAICVRDDGPGFSAEQLAQPITGFQSSKSDGTGLGLYTVERLVRASGGSMTRSNGPGGGAEVRIFLRAMAST